MFGEEFREALWRVSLELSSVSLRDYQAWMEDQDSLDRGQRAAQDVHSIRLVESPSFSFILVDDGVDTHLLGTLESITVQMPHKLELVIACRASRKACVDTLCALTAARFPMVVLSLEETGYTSVCAENAALAAATGDFIAFISAGDRLAASAVAMMRHAMASQPRAAVFYADEDWIDGGLRQMPRFKSAWDPDAQLGFDLLGRLTLIRRHLIVKAGYLDARRMPAEHYDLHCRVTAGLVDGAILHVPVVLYHRRVPQAVSQSRISDALDAYATAARDAAAATASQLHGEPVKVRPSALAPFVNCVEWTLPDPAPLVSIVVPTRDMSQLLGNCARGVLQETDYPSIELLILDNGSELPDTKALFETLSQDRRVRILPMPGTFNFSKVNNDGVAAARGEVIVMLNNDIEILNASWLREMVALAMRPEVGCVGAKLLYQDRRIQHAGVVLQKGPLAMHVFRTHEHSALGHDGQLAGLRSYLGVTAACLAIRRTVFEEVGGLDAAQLSVSFNDVDLCLKVADAGYRNVCTPFASLLHLESASRGSDESSENQARSQRELASVIARWSDRFDSDPYSNPNLSYDWNRGVELSSDRRAAQFIEAR